MQIFFMILLIILSVSLIITVTLRPRQIQIFSSDATSNIGIIQLLGEPNSSKGPNPRA